MYVLVIICKQILQFLHGLELHSLLFLPSSQNMQLCSVTPSGWPMPQCFLGKMATISSPSENNMLLDPNVRSERSCNRRNKSIHDFDLSLGAVRPFHWNMDDHFAVWIVVRIKLVRLMLVDEKVHDALPSLKMPLTQTIPIIRSIE